MHVGTCIVGGHAAGVAPVSACTSGMSSSIRSRRRSAALFSSAARSSGFVRLHAGKASAAAAAAASTWATRRLGRLADHGLGGRVDDLVGARVAVDPLAADEELVPRCCHPARLERVLVV